MSKQSDAVDLLMSNDDLDEALEEVFPPRPDRLFAEHDAERIRQYMSPEDYSLLQFETLVSTAELQKYFGVTPQWVLLNLAEQMFTPPVRLGTQAYWRIDEISEIFNFIDLSPNDNLGLRTLVHTLVETRPKLPTSAAEYKVRSGEIRQASQKAATSRGSAISMFNQGLN